MISDAVDGYLDIGGFLDAGLAQQIELDVESFTLATGRHLSDAERAAYLTAQHQATRWTFLGSGMSHPKFIEAMGALSMDRKGDLLQAIPQFS